MTAIAPPIVVAPDVRIILRGVSWSTYEGLLNDQFGRRSPRFTYDRGWLEIMVTSHTHEEFNRTLALVVQVVAEELGIDFYDLGQATHKREDIEQGFEPDSCFFFGERPRLRSTLDFDPATDRAPDLVLEVDISSESLSRFPIFAGFGVPEVWRYHNGSIRIWSLQLGTYTESDASAFIPLLTPEVLTRFLEESMTTTKIAWLKSVRAWLREQNSARNGG